MFYPILKNVDKQLCKITEQITIHEHFFDELMAQSQSMFAGEFDRLQVLSTTYRKAVRSFVEIVFAELANSHAIFLTYNLVKKKKYCKRFIVMSFNKILPGRASMRQLRLFIYF